MMTYEKANTLVAESNARMEQLLAKYRFLPADSIRRLLIGELLMEPAECLEARGYLEQLEQVGRFLDRLVAFGAMKAVTTGNGEKGYQQLRVWTA
jgi:hypothetical protein